MEEILKEVLLKKCGNRKHDQVLIIENIPSKFFYELTAKMIPRKDRDGYMDGTMTIDPSGEMVWTLYPGIERSQTGDGGYLFWVGERESEARLKDIMRYVDSVFPRDQRIPSFIDNAQIIGEMNTGPIMHSQIPRISLPIITRGVSISVVPNAVSVVATEPKIKKVDKIEKVDKRRYVSPERRQKLIEAAAKARAAKKQKIYA